MTRFPRLPLVFRSMWWLFIVSLGLTGASASAATRILFLGDSFSKGPFGRTLDASLRAAGLEVYTSVTGGASCYDWLPEYGRTSCDIGYWEKTPRNEYRVGYISRVPKLDEMVARWKPNIVVIQGGTNMYSVLTSKRRPHDANVAELERLLSRVGEIVTSGKAKLYWITPATAHAQRFSPELQAEMRSILTRVGGRYGRVYDSYSVTRFTEPYPGSDGIHYGPTEANAWSRLVAKDLTAYARGRGVSGGRSAGSGRGLFSRFLSQRSGAPAPETGRAKGSSNQPQETVRRVEPAPPIRPGLPADDEELGVDVALRQKSTIPNLGEITYRSALGIFEYDVLNVSRGSYPHKTIRVAQLIVMNNQYTPVNDWKPGRQTSFLLEKLSHYPNLLKLQTIDDLEPAYELPIFVPKL